MFDAGDVRGDLPPGWAWATLGQLVPSARAKVPADRKSDLPFVGMDNIAAGEMAPNGFGRFGDMKSAGSKFESGDVLYGRLRPYLNKVWRADRLGVASAEFIVLPNCSAIESNFLALLLHQIRFVQFASSLASGDRPRVDYGQISSFRFGLPPLPEQRRIVAKIEELFGEIEAGEQELEKAREGLATYRRAILKAAVTGELTREWREKNPPNETGADLLTRILADRRATWERAELAKMEAKGKRPTNDSWKARYPEPIASDADSLPELPQGWEWSTLDQLSTRMTSGSRAWSPYYDQGTSVFIMAQNVRPGHFDTRFRQLVDPPANDPERKRTRVQRDDLLLTIVGANTGDVCRVDLEIEDHYVCQSVALIRLVDASLSEYTEAYLVADEGGQRAFAKHIYGAGRPHLSFDQIRSVHVPLPPQAEQRHVVGAYQELQAELRQMSSDIEGSHVASESLRQSILNAAFSGKLVPQDPADEPASALLARIQAQRESAPRPRARRPRTIVEARA